MKFFIKRILVILPLLLPFWGNAQDWTLRYQTDSPISFHMTQKDGMVYVTKEYTDIEVFLRVTDEYGEHKRYYFEGSNYLEVEMPNSGYIALMSENEAEMVQYMYASEEISNVKYTDNQKFFAFAEKSTTPPTAAKDNGFAAEETAGFTETAEGTAETVEESGATASAIDRDGNSGGRSFEEHSGFDPHRETTEYDPGAEEGNTQETQPETAANTDCQDNLDELLSKINDLKVEIRSLRSQVTAQAEANTQDPEIDIKSIGKFNLIMSGYSGFFRVESNCESCPVQSVTGIPVIGSMGLAINYPKFTLGVMGSLGLQLHDAEPGGRNIRPTAGGRLMFITDKYAFSGGALSTRNLDTIIMNVGMGLPVSKKMLVMLEAGYVFGHMSMIPARQFSTTLGLSLTYNFRKSK